MSGEERRRRAQPGSMGVGVTTDEHALDVPVATQSNTESGSQLTLPLSRGIHAMRAEEATEVNEPRHDAAAQDGIGAAESQDHGTDDSRLGQRLCAARERKGWTRAEVAARLKLPANLIARLENDDYEGLTQGVFLQGYLSSYARLVGIPVEHAASVAAEHTHSAPLVATGTISHSRYLFERYSVSATYLVLTAIFVVPAVWLATHGGLDQNLARTTPLDPPANIVAVAPHEPTPETVDAPASADTVAAPALVAGESPQAPAAADPSPVIASMTPFPSALSPALPAAAPAASQDAPAVIGSGAHTLELTLAQQSWVEVTAADGRRLEYGMLAAGSVHNYRSDGPVSVRLGNAQGAQIRSDGALVDLAPFQRGNVAHVKLFDEASAQAAPSNQ